MNTPFVLPPKVIDEMNATKNALTGATLEKFKELLAHPQSSAEKFRSLLSAERIVALVAAIPQNVPSDLPNAIRQTVAPLTELVERELPGLQKHSGFKRAVVESIEEIRQQKEFEEKETALRPKTVVGVAASPMLIGPGDVVTPILRLVLQTNPSGENFEFYANSDDLSYLVSAFAEYLAEMLEERVSLARKGVIKITNPDAIAENLADAERAFEKIRQFAPQYGIELGSAKKSAPTTDATGS